ncbi:exodeoxyribonuclease III [Thiohalobacter thiocyanaticus]|uniref:Exodeoxyribonuclease III n=1 Tax=Thiohalobacter thiocyanaticus TaxID=585455 RepID=A0A426QKA4_9GAMM|nr:exodeoxyribonuclease III [Thiohalobacter thiocyanaticus]RRQ22178.1 exodeoxyribonuclease III [Thiohalobacter thiocyanaticus]
MRVITLNANGIRAAARKGLYPWLARQRADFVCLQETRAQEYQLADRCFRPRPFHCFYHDAEKKGYSGVAIYSRHRPDRVVHGLGWPGFDAEGRWLEVQVGRLNIISLYLPSGTSSESRQQVKFEVLERLLPYLKSLRRKRREYIICGDWNMAHKPIDLKNWRSNQKNSGFLPEERAWLDRLFDEAGYVDGHRVADPRPEVYTWWSNRGRAWEKNVGWRIDYQIITPGLRERVRRARVYTARRFSDHAPLIMDYDWPLPDGRGC